MSPNHKIVNIHDRKSKGDARLPSALIRMRDLSARRLQMLLGEFFDEADDALFAMSDRAGSNTEQTAYFDAMRELRMQRKHMTLSFLQWVARAFNEIGRFKPSNKGDEGDAFDRDSLSLVDHSDMEEQVAIENMVTKVRNRYDHPVRLLQARVEYLLPQLSLVASQNPLGPEVLCYGLAEACADLSIDIRAKLVIYKLFDRLLVGRLGDLYDEANLSLANDGILPDLKNPPAGGRKGPAAGTQGRGSTPSSGGAVGHNDGDTTSFDELSSLLHGGGGQGGAGVAGGQATLQTDQLLGYLSDVQTDGSVAQLNANGGSGLQTVVTQLVQNRGQGNQQVRQVDADVINLVSMLFDFILEDRQLPEKMKALLTRLQIPYLKVALLDRSFFNRGGHPARKLLNELAMASIGWNEKGANQRDPLGDKIQGVVDRLLNEFENDVSVFQEVLDDFTHFMDLERRRQELVEQRLRDAEEGKARRQQAQQAVQAVIHKASEGREIPENVQALLEQPWSKYLHWLILREGEESEAWQEKVKLTEDLIWSVDPRPVDGDTRGALLRSIPSIVDGVRQGLSDISWDPFAADRLIRDLEMTHVDTLQQLQMATAFQKAEEPEDTVEAPVQRASEPAATPQPTAPEPEPVAEPTAAAEAEPVAETTPPASSAIWRDKAQNLRVGSWLELTADDKVLRCKLAAIIKATGKYIFVNRSGSKVAEYTLDEVAEALEEQRIQMLDDGLIFDRALESVIGNLRDNRRD
ncbi:DUF1631 domain-containing protein [Marinobacteraceae bacterium S3BR75-40.1]